MNTSQRLDGLRNIGREFRPRTKVKEFVLCVDGTWKMQITRQDSQYPSLSYCLGVLTAIPAGGLLQ